MRAALEERSHDSTFRVIPVLLPGADARDAKVLPRFLRRLTWVDFRGGLDDVDEFERLIAGVLGSVPRESALKVVADAPAEQGIIHPLPPAPAFVGRSKELARLREFWHEDDTYKVLSLIGLGGAGKTAIAARFLSSLLAGEVSLPDALFVWSFYVDQDANNFLRTAFQFFGRRGEATAAGVGLLYGLADVLSRRGRCLIIMDGLERVQRTHSDWKGAFGEIEDPLLRQIVSRLAFGIGKTKCLITSRFPVSDLSPWRGRYYEPLEIDQLELADARQLLNMHGVEGDEYTLNRVIDEYGSHALTLDHLGVYLSEFCNGDPTKAHELEEARIDSDVREERKLARVLFAYERTLTQEELDLLMRFCIFRSGTTADTLFQLFAGEKVDRESSGSLAGLSQNDFKRIVRRLAGLHLLLPESE